MYKTKVVCLADDPITEVDVMHFEEKGTATVDIRYHAIVLLIDMDDMDTRTLCPLNLYPTDELANDDRLPYDCYMDHNTEKWHHVVKINDKWRTLEFMENKNALHFD